MVSPSLSSTIAPGGGSSSSPFGACCNAFNEITIASPIAVESRSCSCPIAVSMACRFRLGGTTTAGLPDKVTSETL